MKRAYKLQEFVAHSSNVNCLKIGKKSSRVLVTGGEDHKVNMWAIGKPNAILSLAGHTSAVESVTFDSSEVVVVAGSASGTIKLWDLEEAKIVRTLTGHRSNCISVDFHPFGEFFASGSLDTNLKIWDIRRKGCIHTYKGHTRGINAIKFSPDGRWVVSGGEDNVVKLWDLTAGKLMHDFKYHEGQVQCLDFHPHEFLLATGSADRTVKFFDLETFELIGSAGPEPAGVRAMVFNTDGRTILTAMQDSLKIFSWEPLRCHDMVDIGWHKLADLCIHEGKLLGCSFNQSCVGIWVVDLQRVAPYHSGNQVWKDDLSVGNQISNNGNQAPQEATPTSHTKSDSTTSLPHMMDMAMRNVKITSPKAAESSNSQPTQSTFNIGRRPASVQAMAPSSATPTFPSRRSSITTPKLVASSGFRLSSRADAHTGCSPRPSTAPECCQGLDDTRPTSTTGVVSMSTSKSYDRGLDNVRGDGNDDGHGDTSRIDPILHASRSSSAKDSVRGSDSRVRGSDSSVRGQTFQHASKPSLVSMSTSKSYDRGLDNVRGDGNDDGHGDTSRIDPILHASRSSSAKDSVRGSDSRVRGSDSSVRGQTFQHASKPSLVSMSTSKSYDRGLDNVRGDGNDDGHGDTSRIDPIPHASRSSSAKDSVRGSDSSVRGSDSSVRGSDSSVRGSDSSVRGQTSQHASKPSLVSMSTSKSYDRGLDNVRGDGNDDGHGDTSRIDPIPHASRSSSVKDSVRGSNSSVRGSDSSVRGSDINVRGQTFQHASKPSLHSHLGTKEDNATLNWNGARSYSSRRSSTCDVPVDNSLGRSHSFSDESSRAQPTRNATGTEASTTGRLEVGCTTALPGQWERKEKLSLQETPTLVEKPAVLERSSHQPRSFVVEKSGSLNVPSGGGGGVRTLGLDINSFVPKGSNFQSERTISAAKHDTDIIKELLLQHHMMSSIMQSRMTNMQVVRRYWNKNDMKGAIEAMKKMTDHSVLVEVLSAFMEKTNLLTLEICYLLIPLLNGLLSTDNDRFLMTALELLEKLVETFGPIIYETRTSSSSIGVDLQAEQRLDRCNMCYHELQAVGHSLLPLMRIGGDVTNAARNLQEALGRI